MTGDADVDADRSEDETDVLAEEGTTLSLGVAECGGWGCVVFEELPFRAGERIFGVPFVP